MNHWRELEGTAQGRDVLVIGNGPSRIGHAIDDRRLLTIACNAYWREAVPDFLVCYDAPQTRMALADGPKGLNLLVPEQRDDTVKVDVLPEDEDRVWEVAPHQGGGIWTIDEMHRPGWSPLQLSIGNLSGPLAYQVALVLRPRAIYLHGMDCSGILAKGGESVRLSAFDDSTPGYGPGLVPRQFVRTQTLAPMAWELHRTLWHDLTRWGADHGIKTYRVRDAGALDWLEVRHPCPDRRTEERPASPTRH